ncbi:MAG: hypothetical protein LBI36_00390 [Oscillospiraceae bacterium]|jgi:HPt (histidine-containing phosphotransfer) domain-containing protein|nr:hypothetical protein [Oscillospiraceae bacterium]
MTNDEKILALRGVDELDVDAGLKVLSGLTGPYLKVLRIAVKTEKKDKGVLEGLLAENKYDDFRVIVHGYKSALANIGALKLSATAKELEASSSKGERAEIEAVLPGFLSRFSAFAEKLSEILGEE